MRAWILGAGFSVRLGGPLLNDLLSVSSLARLRRRHPNTWLNEPECDSCVSVLARGLERKLWKNAEEYIAALGSYDPLHQQDVGEMCKDDDGDWRSWGGDPSADATSSLYCHSIALIAAQCMDFVQRASDDLEAWLPYDRWVRALPPEDVLISFNYDEVVEEAFRRNGKFVNAPNPRTRDGLPPCLEDQLLLKLHGGVNVRDTILDPPEEDAIVNLVRNPARIAVPGNSKCDAHSTAYSELWELASEALREAEEVAIVGYSCPPSDEIAKAMLLDTLGDNMHRPVDIVVGAEGSPAAQRLISMLRHVGARARDTGLLAEDYLSAHGQGQGWDVLDARV